MYYHLLGKRMNPALALESRVGHFVQTAGKERSSAQVFCNRYDATSIANLFHIIFPFQNGLLLLIFELVFFLNTFLYTIK